jgi:hypothetical protein
LNIIYHVFDVSDGAHCISDFRTFAREKLLRGAKYVSLGANEKTHTLNLYFAPVVFFQNGPSWRSDFCSKNGQQYCYLQCFVTQVSLKLKTVILEHKIEFTSKGYHMLS